MHHDILNHYEQANFTGTFHGLADYCAHELSSFYLDIIKDRLYVEQADGKERRSAQTVLWHILDTLTRDMAPILSFTAEHLSDFYQKDKAKSIHLQNFSDVEKFKQFTQDDGYWNFLKTVRSAVLKALEGQRELGVIKHSLEAAVHMYIIPEYFVQFPQLRNFIGDTQSLKEFFIVSQVYVKDDSTDLNESAVKGIFVNAQAAEGSKCPRCWNWDSKIDSRGLCQRCSLLVT